MKLPSPTKLRKLALNLDITTQGTGTSGSWVLNAEQLRLAETILGGGPPSTIVLKSRQIGTSTFFCLLDLVVALMNPGIRVALVVDTYTKATDLLSRIRDFARQLSLPLEYDSARRIRLANASEVVAITASGGAEDSGSKVGRSQSYQWLHMSELPYWPNPGAYASLLATSSGSPVIIESTARGSGDLFYRLYQSAPGFNKLFFGVESHAEYVALPESITDYEWRECESLGFKSRPHAAYWWALLRQSGGDLTAHLHDYPVTDQHPWLTSDSRWINVDPEITQHEPLGDIKIYERPHGNARYLAGVDTSGGIGRDGNAIAVLNRTSGKLAAYWIDRDADTYTIVDTLKVINQIYRPDITVVETNGIGRATYAAAQRAGIPVTDLTTTAATRYQSLVMAKQAIERKEIYGPVELREECASLHLDPRRKFKGAKDSLMAIGFCLYALQDNRYRPPVIRPPEEPRYNAQALLAPKGNWY